jgi:hypothetical protein
MLAIIGRGGGGAAEIRRGIEGGLDHKVVQHGAEVDGGSTHHDGTWGG